MEELTVQSLPAHRDRFTLFTCRLHAAELVSPQYDLVNNLTILTQMKNGPHCELERNQLSDCFNVLVEARRQRICRFLFTYG